MSPGYVTGTGPEVSAGPAYWVTHWEHLSQGGLALFVLHASDGWGLLEDWHARRQYTWVAGDVSLLGLLRFVLTRVELTLAAPDLSATLTDHKPEFTIHPGESGGTAVRRLLTMAPDRLFFRGQQGRLREPKEADATDYALGTDHAVLKGRYAQAALQRTLVQVYGATDMVESFLWEEVPLRGELLLQQHDRNLDTAQKAQDRGQQLVRQLEMESRSGEATSDGAEPGVPPQPHPPVHQPPDPAWGLAGPGTSFLHSSVRVNTITKNTSLLWEDSWSYARAP